MKNLAFLFMAITCFSFVSLTGCGDGGPKVIEAPPAAEEEDPAMAGMSEEDYNKAMEESMK